MTADEGALVDQLKAIGKASIGLQGQASGIGPAVMWTHAISGRDVTFIGKWMHDMNDTTRFEGDRVFLCAALAVHRKTHRHRWALASGALASGVGYAIWYRALAKLSAPGAATLQLAVPVLAGWAGVVVLDEPVTARLVLAGAAILGGIALARDR